MAPEEEIAAAAALGDSNKPAASAAPSTAGKLAQNGTSGGGSTFKNSVNEAAAAEASKAAKQAKREARLLGLDPPSARDAAAAAARGVNNTLMELRNIANHPFLSRLHPPHGEDLLRLAPGEQPAAPCFLLTDWRQPAQLEDFCNSLVLFCFLAIL